MTDNYIFKCCNNCVNAIKFAELKPEYMTEYIRLIIKEKRVCGETMKEYWGKEKRSCSKFFPKQACTICIYHNDCKKERDCTGLSPIYEYCKLYKKIRNSRLDIVSVEMRGGRDE